MVPALPWELVSTIIQEVIDRNTLLSLCLASKATFAEASRWLYDDISDNLNMNADRHCRLVETLVKAPHLASLVHSYTIDSVASICPTDSGGHLDCDDDAGNSMGKVDTPSLLWSILPEALSLMSNLEYLFFREMFGSLWPTGCYGGQPSN